MPSLVHKRHRYFWNDQGVTENTPVLQVIWVG
jgi:hypothetical protein